MKLAIIIDGIVDHFINSIQIIPDGSTAVVVDGLNVNVSDLYDPKQGGQSAFTLNPQAADLAAAATAVASIVAQLSAVTTTADLKTIVAQVNADVNP